jgi:cation diffusion facilitator family transporter
MVRSQLKYPVLLSILAGVITLFLKLLAYWLTGSVGLLSEVAESATNLLAAATALFTLWYAARPVDPSHTYGHEKIEFFSSGLEGALILVGAVAVAWYAIRRLFTLEPLQALDIGAALAGVAALINLAVGQVLLRAGRIHGSIVLQADGRHLMADVWTSAAVIAGLVMVRLTNLYWLDPALGLCVIGFIVWSGFDLVRTSFNGLMDHALPVEEQTTVRQAIERQLEKRMDYHALRTRQAGSRRFVDFHLLVPGNLTVRKAHELTARIEEAIARALPNVAVTVHIEPIEDRSAWEDSELVPLEQAERRARAENADP